MFKVQERSKLETRDTLTASVTRGFSCPWWDKLPATSWSWDKEKVILMQILPVQWRIFWLVPSLVRLVWTSPSYSVQFSSVAQLCPTLRPHELQHARPPCPSQLPEFTQTHIHQVSDAIQPSHPLSSPSPPAPNSSQNQSLFQWVNSLMRWPKYWSFSFSIIPSKEIPGLISFRMDWLDLLAVQGTLN